MGTGAITVNNTATLAGTGSLAGAVTVDAGGTLAPGVGGVGTLTLNGGVTLNGTLASEFDSTGAGSSDVIAVTGDLDISNTTLDLTALAGADDPEYLLATWTGTLTGSNFASVSGVPAGYGIAVDQTAKTIKLVAVQIVVTESAVCQRQTAFPSAVPAAAFAFAGWAFRARSGFDLRQIWPGQRGNITP